MIGYLITHHEMKINFMAYTLFTSEKLGHAPHPSRHYRSPLVDMTTRVSIRSLIKSIESHSKERIKNRLSHDMLKFLIERVPRTERDEYARHVMPVIAMYDNMYVYREMVSSGFRTENTWTLFQALYSGNEELCKAIVQNQRNILNEEDLIPYKFAAYIGRRVSIRNLFKMGDIEDLTHRMVYDSIAMDKLCQTQLIYVESALVHCKRRIEAKEITVAKARNRRDELAEIGVCTTKNCECPSESIKHLEDMMKMLLSLADDSPKGYSVSNLDKLAQIVRAYGMLKWGYIEVGGHVQLDIYFR